LTVAPERINATGVVLLIHRYLIGALWLVWAGWWMIAAWATKPALRSEGAVSRLSHVLPLALGAALLISRRLAGAALARRFLPDVPWTFWLGLTLVAGGIAIALWARVHLGGNWSGTVTLKQGHTLTCEGPYRFVRHPIYAGLLLAVLGTAISQGEWRGLAAVALITLALLRKIALEERFLRARFGREYERYRAALPALIPQLPHCCALRHASSHRSDH
jgi:protein-S-isoprenylcysteine O-methyltransferase Ste14